MITILKHLFAFVLFIVCSSIICFFAYFTLVSYTDWWALLHDPKSITNTQITALALCAVVPISFLVLFAPIFSIKPKPSWFGRFFRTLLIMAMLGFVGYQLYDDRKMHEVFTAKDLESRHPENATATFLITPILEQSSRPIPDTANLSGANFYHNIVGKRQEIEEAWDSISLYRNSINQLADLNVLPQPVTRSDEEPSGFSGVEDILRIYRAYSLLQIERGERVAGINALNTIHRVGRNGLAGAIYSTEKRMWTKALGEDIRIAYQIAGRPETTVRDIALLTNSFSPLTLKELSLHNVWLSEYLEARELLQTPVGPKLQKRLIGQTNSPPLLLKIMPPWFFSSIYRLTCQKNRSERLLLAFWQPIIESSNVLVAALEKAGFSLERYEKNPPLRNLSGWYFHRPVLYPELERDMVVLQGASAVLAAYLQDKVEFGGGVESYLGGEWGPITVDNDKITAPGIDKKQGTEDDIILQPLY